MDDQTIANVAVVGAGLMGHNIGLEFARQGFDVTLNDLTQAALDRALAAIDANLRWMVAQGLVAEEEVGETLDHIRAIPDLETAVQAVDFVVEACFEDLDVKRRLFADLDRLSPSHAILASNTSGLSADRLAEATARPDRVLVTHFWNPPHLMPLVEVVTAASTSPTTLQKTLALLRRIDKTPVVLKRGVPGFIGNRLQFALLREAFHLLQEGVAGPEEIDTVMKLTLGRRYSTVGPLETADLAGLDLFLSISSYLFPELGHSTEPPPPLRERVERSDLGVKTGKGFYEWTAERAEKVRQTRNAELARWLRERIYPESTLTGAG